MEAGEGDATGRGEDGGAKLIKFVDGGGEWHEILPLGDDNKIGGLGIEGEPVAEGGFECRE